jgi:hypothetical protein
MKHIIKLLLSGILLLSLGNSQAQNIEKQIKEATIALPEELREGATVMGYGTNGELSIIKKGTNDQICLADDPTKKGFQVSCYHKDLEPFMARGRELQKEKKTNQEIFDIRESEAKSGKLEMPKNASTLHIFYGENAEKGNYRYVVYIPWATPETTGLPLKPMVSGGPWIMDPGTHRAHIMISPPNSN